MLHSVSKMFFLHEVQRLLVSATTIGHDTCAAHRCPAIVHKATTQLLLVEGTQMIHSITVGILSNTIVNAILHTDTGRYHSTQLTADSKVSIVHEQVILHNIDVNSSAKVHNNHIIHCRRNAQGHTNISIELIDIVIGRLCRTCNIHIATDIVVAILMIGIDMAIPTLSGITVTVTLYRNSSRRAIHSKHIQSRCIFVGIVRIIGIVVFKPTFRVEAVFSQVHVLNQRYIQLGILTAGEHIIRCKSGLVTVDRHAVTIQSKCGGLCIGLTTSQENAAACTEDGSKVLVAGNSRSRIGICRNICGIISDVAVGDLQSRTLDYRNTTTGIGSVVADGAVGAAGAVLQNLDISQAGCINATALAIGSIIGNVTTLNGEGCDIIIGTMAIAVNINAAAVRSRIIGDITAGHGNIGRTAGFDLANVLDPDTAAVRRRIVRNHTALDLCPGVSNIGSQIIKHNTATMLIGRILNIQISTVRVLRRSACLIVGELTTLDRGTS